MRDTILHHYLGQGFLLHLHNMCECVCSCTSISLSVAGQVIA